MTAPVWLRTALAGLMIAVAIGCAIRLGFGRRRGLRLGLGTDGLHVAMGVAMAGMLLPRLSVLPAAAWATGFGAGAIWFGWQVIAGRRVPTVSAPLPRARSPLPQARSPLPHARSPLAHAPLAHLIECVAMVFMLLPAAALAPGSAFAGPLVVFALLLALCMVGYAVWTADTLVRGPAAVAIAERKGVRLAAGGSIAMSVAMWYMLIQMV